MKDEKPPSSFILHTSSFQHRAMPHERRQVHYRGQVQGVGFRFTARQIAQQFAVSGYVRNLSDGRVELVAEGEPNDLDRFLAELESSMRGYVSGTETRQFAATGEFESFETRR
jgi:acylphosphatase